MTDVSSAARALVLGGLLAFLGRAAWAEPYGFPLTDAVSGKRVSLSEFKDAAVLVELWQTTCGPCKAVKPELEKLQADFQDRNFAVLSVDAGESRETVSAYLRTHPTTLRVLRDEKERVARTVKLSGVPSLFLLDANGRLAWAATGFGPATAEDLKWRIGQLAPGTAKLGLVKP